MVCQIRKITRIIQSEDKERRKYRGLQAHGQRNDCQIKGHPQQTIKIKRRRPSQNRKVIVWVKSRERDRTGPAAQYRIIKQAKQHEFSRECRLRAYVSMWREGHNLPRHLQSDKRLLQRPIQAINPKAEAKDCIFTFLIVLSISNRVISDIIQVLTMLDCL